MNFNLMDSLEESDENFPKHSGPSPDDFAAYLPWACDQLQIPAIVQVNRAVQDDYISPVAPTRGKKGKSKMKIAPSRVEIDSDTQRNDKTEANFTTITNNLAENVIRISTVYDTCDNLLQIKFENNKIIPRSVWSIVGLIIKFQQYLNSVIVRGRLDKYTLHEFRKFLPKSHITDLCLDSTHLPEGNYHIILEQSNYLRQLSLSRCSINDTVVETIASTLSYPLPASRSLTILNLSSNRITNVGAKYLANALRSNRRLEYLNLASNMLTDEGVDAILNILLEFPLTCEEIVAAKSRKITYLIEKRKIIQRVLQDVKIADVKSLRKKTLKPTPPASAKKAKGLDKEPSLKAIAEPIKLNRVDSVIHEKADVTAINILGVFNDPFMPPNVVSKMDFIFCKGNNALAYLNISYNNLGFPTIEKLLKVLLYQRLEDRRPRGLVNVCIEGNNLPKICAELTKIDDILMMGLLNCNRRFSLLPKKRPQIPKSPR